jgi:LysM repeat protein
MGEPIDPTRIVNLDTKDLIADTISIDQGWFRHLTNPGPPKTTSFSGYHTIRKGDTLSGISKKYHVSVSRICKMNRITPTTTLKLGRKLKLV